MALSLLAGRSRVYLCIAAVGLVASGLAWFRLTSVTEQSNPQKYWRHKGASVYAKMAKVPVSNSDAVRTVFEQAVVDDPHGRLVQKTDIADSLRSTVADFLLARYTAASPNEYIAWMEAQGYRFRTWDEFEQRHGPLDRLAVYPGFTEHVNVESKELRTAFEGIWSFPPSLAATPVELCSDQNSVAIIIGTSNHNRPFTENLTGILGYDLWHGGSTSRCRMWMRPPVTRNTIVEVHGETVAAQVGIIVKTRGSARFPIIVCLFLDPETQRWWIDEVLVTNFTGTDTAWTCTEY